MFSIELDIMLEEGATVPSKAYETDAGLDFYASEDAEINWADVTLVHTGIHIKIPPGWYGQIFDRSGKAKVGIGTLGGVIDCSYRGEVGILFQNIRQTTYKIKKGDKIAQMVFLPVPQLKINIKGSLDETARGDKGYGSSGN